MFCTRKQVRIEFMLPLRHTYHDEILMNLRAIAGELEVCRVGIAKYVIKGVTYYRHIPPILHYLNSNALKFNDMSYWI